jgi:hypothetical protein
MVEVEVIRESLLHCATLPKQVLWIESPPTAYCHAKYFLSKHVAPFPELRKLMRLSIIFMIFNDFPLKFQRF